MKVKVLTITLLLIIGTVAVSSQQVAPPAEVPPVGWTDVEMVQLDRQLVPDAMYSSVTNYYQTQSDDKVLVIPGSEALSDEEMGTVVEDMQIMSHIISLKLNEGDINPLGRRGLAYTWGNNRSSELESMYLEGFGALFMMDTEYSLIAPVEKTAEPKEEAKDKLWTDVRRSLTEPPKGRGYGGTLLESSGRSRTATYSAEAVSKLQDTILQTLVHASNMSQVADDEVIVVHVTGAPQLVQSTETEVEPEVTDAVENTGGGIGGVSGGVAIGLAPPGFSSRGRQAVVGRSTHMVFRAPMTEINALANDEIDFETFKGNVSVVIY
ncbi:MAG: hypothetical protein GY869_26850 [Planctomycetes bacterium]|nr:hypothetical protein [Planctomycetota bacterium]